MLHHPTISRYDIEKETEESASGITKEMCSVMNEGLSLALTTDVKTDYCERCHAMLWYHNASC